MSQSRFDGNRSAPPRRAGRDDTDALEHPLPSGHESDDDTAPSSDDESVATEGNSGGGGGGGGLTSDVGDIEPGSGKPATDGTLQQVLGRDTAELSEYQLALQRYLSALEADDQDMIAEYDADNMKDNFRNKVFWEGIAYQFNDVPNINHLIVQATIALELDASCLPSNLQRQPGQNSGGGKDAETLLDVLLAAKDKQLSEHQKDLRDYLQALHKGQETYLEMLNVRVLKSNFKAPIFWSSIADQFDNVPNINHLIVQATIALELDASCLPSGLQRLRELPLPAAGHESDDDAILVAPGRNSGGGGGGGGGIGANRFTRRADGEGADSDDASDDDLPTQSRRRRWHRARGETLAPSEPATSLPGGDSSAHAASMAAHAASMAPSTSPTVAPAAGTASTAVAVAQPTGGAAAPQRAQDPALAPQRLLQTVIGRIHESEHVVYPRGNNDQHIERHLDLYAQARLTNSSSRDAALGELIQNCGTIPPAFWNRFVERAVTIGADRQLLQQLATAICNDIGTRAPQFSQAATTAVAAAPRIQAATTAPGTALDDATRQRVVYGAQNYVTWFTTPREEEGPINRGVASTKNSRDNHKQDFAQAQHLLDTAATITKEEVAQLLLDSLVASIPHRKLHNHSLAAYLLDQLLTRQQNSSVHYRTPDVEEVVERHFTPRPGGAGAGA